MNTDLSEKKPDFKLDKAEEMFKNLIDDERLFNTKKFEKALIQEKQNIWDRKNKMKAAKRKRKAQKSAQQSMLKNSGNKGNDLNFGEEAAFEPGKAAAASQSALVDPNKEKLDQIKKKNQQTRSEASKLKREKAPGIVNVFGELMIGAKTSETYSFFQDLNYGDMVVAFNNSYYDFMLKERQELELYQLNHLEALKGKKMGKVSMSAEKTKKREKYMAHQTTKINEKFKKMREVDSKKNIRINLYDAYKFYNKHINVRSQGALEDNDDEKEQKRAFANALIYFSDRYYVNDMSRVKESKKPYSEESSYYLRDFLRDGLFEFNLFHRIAMNRFYYPQEESGNSENNIFGPIQDKPKPKLTLWERMMRKDNKECSIQQLFGEKSNYFFIKRDDKEPWIRAQYQQYLNLTEKLNEKTLEFFKVNQKSLDGAEGGEENASGDVPSFSVSGYVKLLTETSKLDESKCRELLEKDMARRGVSDIKTYFSDYIITLKKSVEKRKSGSSTSKKEVYKTSVTNLMKPKEGCLLFPFEENLSHVLDGFTIDLRIFFYLLKKMIILKMNRKKIWTRQFYSQDLKLVFLILKPFDQTIEERAAVRLGLFSMKNIQSRQSSDS